MATKGMITLKWCFLNADTLSDSIAELEEERLYIDCHPYGENDDKFCGHFFWMDYKDFSTAGIL